MDLIARLYLNLELAQWRRAGRQPALWWRDDDARRPSAALDRLLRLAGQTPLSLAIVPDGDLTALAQRLAGTGSLTISQHGVDHQNRAPSGAAASEYPPGAALEKIARRIAAGRQAMTAAGLPPAFYTPPWNEVGALLPAALVQAGFKRLSAAGPAEGLCGLQRLDTDLDILRWKPAPRFRGNGRLIYRLARLLRQRRQAGAYDTPVGLLTHHLVHDHQAWIFLAWLMRFSRRQFVWLSFGEAIDGLQS